MRVDSFWANGSSTGFCNSLTDRRRSSRNGPAMTGALQRRGGALQGSLPRRCNIVSKGSSNQHKHTAVRAAWCCGRIRR